jgi:hypothetical protein
MKTVRTLSVEGIKRFREFLNQLRAGGNSPPPMDLLDGGQHSEPLSANIEIDNRNFVSRLEAAEYLTTKFGGIRDVHYGTGLWTWLTLFYFDQVCPPNEIGNRKVNEEARYIPGLGSWRYYRHLLAGPFRIYQLYGQQSKLFLKGPLAELPDFTEQLSSRLELITNRAIVEAATHLYFDSQNERPKRGAASTKRNPGTLRRFVDLMRQLDLTYDLYSLDHNELLKRSHHYPGRMRGRAVGVKSAAGSEDGAVRLDQCRLPDTRV